MSYLKMMCGVQTKVLLWSIVCHTVCLASMFAHGSARFIETLVKFIFCNHICVCTDTYAALFAMFW